MLSVLFSVYFFLLILFSFVQNPIVCSLILMVNSIILGVILYSLVNSWLSVLLLLVYFGGIYVIIMFVSSYVQNDNDEDFKMFVNIFWALFVVCGFKCLFSFGFYYFGLNNKCFWSEGSVLHDYCFVYLFLCFFLLFIFYLVSFVFYWHRSGFSR
uniref:NADH dehydrogenase subunit 6 n=1 Tax=Eudiplozoon nipponicum TaxID=116851 RepID=UPI001F141877|nr:NADH dehydrogenase subunit 6 [Eudiplozoon nipponicum]UKQ56151.1 NADH dehydrogenase subunit 6 [Eudiplozoon nipponicum]